MQATATPVVTVGARVGARIGKSLAGLGVAGLGLLGAAFYRRPFATLRAIMRLGLLIGGAREGVVAVRGVPLRYLAQGPADRPTIVLLHGLGDSAETWTRLWPFLARDYRLIAPDLAGFGRSTLPPEGMSLTVLVDYLAGLLDALGVGRAVLVGNSLGGAVAIRYAARHPGRVARLFLLDSAAYPLGSAGVLEPADRAGARELVAASGHQQRLPGFILDDLVRRARQPARRAYLASAEPTDIRADLPALADVPATIVWGARDRLIPVAMGEYLHAALPGSELIVLPGVGHGPQGEAPRAVAGLVRARVGRPVARHIPSSSIALLALPCSPCYDRARRSPHGPQPASVGEHVDVVGIGGRAVVDAREYIRRQFVALRRLQDGVMQGTTDEQFNWTPPGTANPIRVAFVHLVSGEDAFIGAIGGRERLWDSGGWAAKVGISAPPGRGQGWEELKAATIPVAPVLEYAAAARAATEAYLATLTPEELDRPVTIFGGERTVADILALLVVHTTGHLGEIAAIKGSQGVQGLPF